AGLQNSTGHDPVPGGNARSRAAQPRASASTAAPRAGGAGNRQLKGKILMHFYSRRWLAPMVLFAGAACAPAAKADYIFMTPSASSLSGLPVASKAVFTPGAGTLAITVQNLEVN